MLRLDCLFLLPETVTGAKTRAWGPHGPKRSGSAVPYDVRRGAIPAGRRVPGIGC